MRPSVATPSACVQVYLNADVGEEQQNHGQQHLSYADTEAYRITACFELFCCCCNHVVAVKRQSERKISSRLLLGQTASTVQGLSTCTLAGRRLGWATLDGLEPSE
jgi:hypothetical protein